MQPADVTAVPAEVRQRSSTCPEISARSASLLLLVQRPRHGPFGGCGRVKTMKVPLDSFGILQLAASLL